MEVLIQTGRLFHLSVGVTFRGFFRLQKRSVKGFPSGVCRRVVAYSCLNVTRHHGALGSNVLCSLPDGLRQALWLHLDSKPRTLRR